MKQVLFILLAAISFSSQAQSHYVHYLDGSFYGVIKDNSDTFEIQHLGNIRFIKIEGEVYEITRKTELKKVEPVRFFASPVNDGNNYYFKSIPSGEGILDRNIIPTPNYNNIKGSLDGMFNIVESDSIGILRARPIQKTKKK